MKALSVRQPWAWLIVNGFKPVENRSWCRSYPDTCLIHAGLKFDQDGYDFVKNTFGNIPLPAPEEFERGGIVGRVEIVEVVDEMESLFFFGPFGYVLKNAQPCRFFKLRGQLGFYNISEEVASRLEFLRPARERIEWEEFMAVQR